MLTAQLEIDKFGRNGVESRRQPARSFVKNFINFLYTAFAQANYDMTDIDGFTRNVKYLPGELTGANLAIVPPSGNRPSVPIECIGIQVGSSDTAVTPLDYDLGERVHHVDRTPETTNAVMEAFQWSKTIGSSSVYGSNWKAAPFFVPWAVNVYSCKLRVVRSGTLTAKGPLTVGLRRCGVDGKPTGSDLISGSVDGTTLQGLPTALPGTLLEVTFDSQYVVRPYTKYALVMRLPNGDGSNYVSVTHSNESYNRPQHKRGLCAGLSSTDGGTSWSSFLNYNQIYFQVLGRRPNGLCYHGTMLRELIKPVSPPPDMEFTIEALFSNYCGTGVTVKEIGIYATGSTDTNFEAFSFLVARDVLTSPITVAANEILRVRYIVQITV